MGKSYRHTVRGVKLSPDHWGPMAFLMDELGSMPEIGKENMLQYLCMAYGLPEYDVWEAIYLGRLQGLQSSKSTFRNDVPVTDRLGMG
jgi:hypothetical protein